MISFKSSKTSLFALTLCLSASLIAPPGLYAYWTWSPEAGKFVNAEGTAEGPAEEQFTYALRFLEEGKPEKAIEELDNLARRYPNARITADALFQLAVLYEKKSDHMKAFKTYKKIMETYPQSPRIDEVVARTYAIGNLFLSGQKAKLAGFAILPALPKAIEVFKSITDSAPFSAYGDRALFNLAIAYKKSHRYEDAIKSFQRLIDDYPTSELLSDARFQLADTSFQMSIRRVDRDLRNLDVAEESAEEFLREYPDSTISPRAQELIKVINDKNAEKNYKIGLYYEGENYVDSAVIYYEDVAKKYPTTVWAEKCRDRLGRLQDPAKYMKIKEQEIQRRLDSTAGKELSVKSKIEAYRAAQDEESAAVAEREKERLEKERKRLERELGGLSKTKAQSVRTRLKVLQIKENDLKEKWKNLRAKKKYYRKRMTDDLVRAFKRWEESLKAEEYALAREREELDVLGESWNVRTQPLIGLPFQHRRPIKPVFEYKENEIAKLEERADQFRLQANLLQERRSEVLENLEQLNQNLSAIYLERSDLSREAVQAGGEIAERYEALKKERAELAELSQKIKAEEEPAEAGEPKKSRMPFAGVMKTLSIPVAVTGKSISWAGSAMPKFGGSSASASSVAALKDRQTELKSNIAQLKDQIAAAQSALQAEQTEKSEEAAAPAPAPSALPETPQTVEPRAFRKEIRDLNRQIRSRYEEVEDRKKHKDALINDLTQEVESVKQSVSLFERTKAVAKPVTGAAYLMKAFVFGLPDKEREAMKGAQSLEQGLTADQVSKVSALKEEIEYEIIMIDTRRTEILKLEKELKAKEAWAKQHNIPLLDLKVARPDYILQSNFERLGRLIAPKTREEILLNRLEKTTARLDESLAELEAVEAALEAKQGKEVKAEEPEEAEQPEAEPVPALPAVEKTEAPKAQPVDVSQVYKKRERAYQANQDEFEKLFKQYLTEKGKNKELGRWQKQKDKIELERKRLIEDRNKVEQELSNIYRQEAETVESMKALIQEKIAKINETIRSLRFKSDESAARLETEKKRLEGVLGDLSSRVKILRDEEMKVLQPLQVGTNV